MPKNSRTLYREFLNKTAVLNAMRLNFENAFNAGSINSEDITQAYAGLYLDLFTHFENLIEEIFMGLLVGKVAHNNPAIAVRKLKITPPTEAENVILGGNDYVKWLPFENTINRAEIYFSSNPFAALSVQPYKNELTNFIKIRNAIAHKSKSALNKFNLIIANLVLLPVERTPYGYLMYRPAGATGATQFENILNRLTVFAHTMCH